jgi:ribosomal protein S18 acetylase RimI-like enzyme
VAPTIRAAERADLPHLGRLAGQLVRMHHAIDSARFMLVDDVERGYAWWFGRELENEDAVILVAVDASGTIVGYAYARMEERDWNALRDACGALHDVFVVEQARRAGVAKALLTEAIGRLEAKGAPRIVLSTAWSNEPAQRLFESMGFRKTMIEMTRERGG